MCGIVGLILAKGSGDAGFFRALMKQSKIRGLHATGVSWLEDGIVQTKKEPVPEDKFEYPLGLFNSEFSIPAAIGHCRYSTSYLEYNQPNANKGLSVVHNGVVTQELYENWEKLYGYKCETKNDSELLLHCIDSGKHPLVEFRDSSMAVAYLTADGKLRVFRNGQRPLWILETPCFVAVASTEDILIRAVREHYNCDLEAGDDFEGYYYPTEMNVEYEFYHDDDGDLLINKKLVVNFPVNEDLQEKIVETQKLDRAGDVFA